MKYTKTDYILKLGKLLEVANTKFGTSLGLHNVHLHFDIKNSKVAGRAHNRKMGIYKIQLNVDAMQMYPDKLLNRTLVHEVAHIVAFNKPELGARGHNKEWRQIDLSLGGEGTRCHDMTDLPSRSKEFEYIVPEFGKIKLSKIRHRRLQTQGVNYTVHYNGRTHQIKREHFTGS